ncbi:MAG: AAA family ATPase [Spirochaetaceae bacterium]|nr:AAA family ATPase [Spirochaetaceae bacterium]
MRKLKSVTVTKLFGYKGNNYTLDFMDDGQITFVYAFNGVGKTTLLKLIYAVIKQNWSILNSIEFESIILNFNQNEQLIVRKIQDKFSYELLSPKKSKLLGQLPFTGRFRKKAECSEINQFLANIDTDILFANKDYTRVVQSKEVSFEVNEPYIETDEIPISLQDVEQLITQKKQEIKKLKDSKNEIIRNLTPGLAGVGVALGGILSGPIGIINLLTIGGIISTSIGLFNRSKKRRNTVSDQEEIENNLILNEKVLKIPLPDKINYIQKSLEGYILKDEPIDKKIDLYEEIINTYNELTDKTLRINRENGKLEIQTIFSDSELLNPKYLSTGEKSLLLLYFHIIFTIPDSITDEETFVELIDEPEVSMHSTWLINFIKSLKHINEVLNRKDNYQYIITTHSPGITFANSELMVELKRD